MDVVKNLKSHVEWWPSLAQSNTEEKRVSNKKPSKASRCHIKPLCVCLHGFFLLCLLDLFFGKVDLCLLVNIRHHETQKSPKSKNCEKLRPASWRAIARHRSKIGPFWKARGVGEGIPFQIPILNPSICATVRFKVALRPAIFGERHGQFDIPRQGFHDLEGFSTSLNWFIMFPIWKFHEMDWWNTRYWTSLPSG